MEIAVRAATGRPAAEIATWSVGVVDHHIDNMTTERLERVAGTLDDGTPWSLFAKTLRPASASPMWHLIPEPFRERVLHELDWRDEPRTYRSCLATDLPPGIRIPRLWHVEEGDERIVLWLEDVADRSRWTIETYRRAAEGLGRLCGRWPEARVRDELGLRRRELDEYVSGKVVHATLPWLADDATWSDPLVAAATAGDPDLRADLARVVEDLSDLVARCDAGWYGLGHGDATPANILDDGTDLVLVDWSYGAAMPAGLDLAQLVAGAVDGRHTADLGLVAAADAVAVDAYCAGLAAEGVAVDRSAVEHAHRVGLVVRNALTAIDVSHAGDLPEDHRVALLTQRTGLARLALDRLAALAG